MAHLDSEISVGESKRDGAALVAGDERMWNASPNRDRLEIPLESPLADKLKELGYALIFCERPTRIGGTATPDYNARWRNGVASAGYGFHTVDVYLIRLPK